jgi:hypothetical protein
MQRNYSHVDRPVVATFATGVEDEVLVNQVLTTEIVVEIHGCSRHVEHNVAANVGLASLALKPSR